MYSKNAHVNLIYNLQIVHRNLGYLEKCTIINNLVIKYYYCMIDKMNMRKLFGYH